MEKRTRKILFFVFLIIFLLLAPTVVFYFQGYRFDFKNKKITQTGGLFLKAIPKQVEIYLDGRLVKKTDFLSGATIIESLLPKKYHIEVKKSGYFSWTKDLEIKEKEVTEVRHIVLFPENLDFETIVKGVKNFWFSPDGKKIILKEENGKNWALKVYDLERNVKSHLIYENDVSQTGVELLNLEFSEDEDSKEIYLDLGLKEQEKVFSLRLDRVPAVLSERKIIPSSENIIASQVFDDDTYFLDKFGYLFKNQEKLSEKPFSVKQEIEYKINIYSYENQVFIFLQEGKILYLFSSDSKSFEKFFEDVNYLKISPEFEKLVYSSPYEIWVFFLNERKSTFLVRFSEKIQDIFWLNSDYLIFSVGDKIKISEIDNRDRINIIDLVELKNPLKESGLPAGKAEIFWNQVNKKLYIFSQENIYASERLLP